MTVRIQNVIATADLKQPVDARKFPKYPWGIYDSAYYSGLCGYIKDNKMRGKVTVFFTGKMISLGAKEVPESFQQLEHAINILVKERLVHRVRLEPEVRNIVGTMDFNERLDLHTISQSLKGAMLEPEVFPAVIFRSSYKTSCLIFASGKVVIVGAKSEQQLIATANLLKESLNKFIITLS